MRCIPCGGGGLQPELAHLNDCYPPSKALLASGPEYRPLGQDLSKLTYFATNKPSKLASIGDALEKRLTKEATRSTGGYVKSRASLLISLAILKGLLNECKRDIGLFSRSALKIIDRSLDVKVYQGGITEKLDLEVVARATGCFVAFTTFTDGAGIGVDDSLTRTYSSILKKFDALAIWSDPTVNTSEKVDMELQSRTRLIALAALNGASTSDAIFSSNSQFPKQIELILPPLLINIFSDNSNPNNISDLKLETAKIEMDASPSPFFSEFSTKRPIHDRRAPSLHAHVTGEKGPSNSDVLSASVRTLQALVAQCKVGQITHIIDNIISFLDRGNYWKDVERCCWLAERLTAWISLQYRFVVPTRLVEVLFDLQDKPILPKHNSLIAMITSILTSHTSLVGLGVTDLSNNLTALIIRRVKISMTDAMLPPLVQCIASLGTHIYYADQINDIVEEISIRIAELQTSDPSRDEIIRVLVHCIMGVMQVAQKADEHAASRQAFGAGANLGEQEINVDKGKGPQIGTPIDTPRHHTSRRNPISPEVWQETLPLLCEGDYGVRSAYSRALLLFLETELPRVGIPQPSSKTKPNTMEISQYRFCNALHAAIYTLVMSSCLGAGSTESADTSPLIAPTNEKDVKAGGESESDPSQTAAPLSSGAGGKGVSFNITEPSPASTPALNGSGNGTTTPTKQRRGSRRVSLPLNRLHSNAALPSFSNVATPYDFAASVSILDKIHSYIPGPALITGIPMLLALDKDAGSELIRRPGDGRQGAWVLERKRAIRELVAIVWRRIGERWNVTNVEEFAHSTLMALPEPYLVPVLHSWPSDLPLLPGSEEPISFPPHHLEGESSMTARPLIDPDVVLSGIATSQRVQVAFGKDASGLMRRFMIKWSVESAVRDSVERFSSANIRPADDPHYDVASVLMSMNNGSYTSFGGRQQQARSIDVEDLREALGGKTDITPSASGSIISSVDDHSRIHAHTQQGSGSGGLGVGGLPLLTRPQSNGSGATKRRHQPDVKDVLKDIFKDKKRAAKVANGNGNGNGDSSGAKEKSTINGDGDNNNGSHTVIASKAAVNGESTSTNTNTNTNTEGGGMVFVNGIQLGKPVPA